MLYNKVGIVHIKGVKCVSFKLNKFSTSSHTYIGVCNTNYDGTEWHTSLFQCHTLRYNNNVTAVIMSSENYDLLTYYYYEHLFVTQQITQNWDLWAIYLLYEQDQITRISTWAPIYQQGERPTSLCPYATNLKGAYYPDVFLTKYKLDKITYSLQYNGL